MEPKKALDLGNLLRLLVVPCPKCAQHFFVFGLRPGDSYICRNCAHSFVMHEEETIVNFQEAQIGVSSRQDGAIIDSEQQED